VFDVRQLIADGVKDFRQATAPTINRLFDVTLVE